MKPINPLNAIKILANLNKQLKSHHTEEDIIEFATTQIYELTHASYIYCILKHRLDEDLKIAFYQLHGEKQVLNDHEHSTENRSRLLWEMGQAKIIEVVKTQKSLYFPTLQALQEYEESHHQSHLESSCWLAASWLGVPMNTSDRVLGVLVIQDPHREQAYDELERNIIEAIADVVAHAIDYERLHKRFKIVASLEQKLNETEAKVKVYNSNPRIKTEQEIVTEVYNYLQSQPGIDVNYLSIILQDKFTHKLSVATYCGNLCDPSDQQSQEQLIAKFDQNLINQIIRDKKTIIKTSAGDIDGNISEIHDKFKACWIGVPMRIQERAIGVFIVQEPNLEAPEYVYNNNDAEFLDILSDQTGNLIHRIYIERLLATLASIEAELLSQETLTQDYVFQILENRGREVADIYHLSVLLKNEESGHMEPALLYRKGKKIDLDDPSSQAQIQEILNYIPIPLTERIITERKALRFNSEAELRSAFDANPNQVYPKSWLGVPMRVGDDALGVFVVYHKKYEGVYDDHDARFLDELSDCVALALDHVDLIERNQKDFQQRIDDLESLGDIYRAVRQESLEDVFISILEFLAERTYADYIDLWLYDQQQNKLQLEANHQNQRTEQLEKLYIILSDQYSLSGLSGVAIRSKKSVYCYNVAHDNNYIKVSDDVQSELVIPLIFQDKVIGILNLESKKLDGFSEEQRKLAEKICDSAAIAIETARLKNQLEKSNEKLKISSGILEKTMSKGTIVDELEIAKYIQQEASKLMDTGNMYFAVYDQETDEVIFKLVYFNDRPVYIDGENTDDELSKKYKPRKLSAGKGKTEEIIKTKMSIRHTSEESKTWYREKGIDYVGQSDCPWLGVPIVLGDEDDTQNNQDKHDDYSQCLGVIATYKTKDKTATYSKEDEIILTQLAKWAAIALDNMKKVKKIAEQENILTRSLIAEDFIHRTNSIVGPIHIWLDLLEAQLKDSQNLDIQKALTYLGKLKNNYETFKQEFREITNRIKKSPFETTTDISSTLLRVIENFRISHDENLRSGQLEIIENIEDDHLLVKGSDLLIKNSLECLVQNAIDAILNKGKGCLTIECTHHSSRQEVQIKIRDTGIEIDPEDESKIFEPFYTKNKKSGTGYGLWRAKLVFESIGGRITLSNSSSEEKTFTIVLPIRNEC